jgi:transposase InsO family protein
MLFAHTNHGGLHISPLIGQFAWYNERRPHTSLDKLTPNEAYLQVLEKLKSVV